MDELEPFPEDARCAVGFADRGSLLDVADWEGQAEQWPS